jgi:hypothetical protein
MLKTLKPLLIVFIGSIAIALVVRTPVAAYDVYYLTVGNSAYRDRTLDLPDANLSAQDISQKLDQAGAVDGITLISEHAAYMTRDVVLSALNKMASKAQAVRNSLVVYYFIGHGESRAPDWRHVSFLGDYKSSDPDDVKRSRALVYTEEVKELLEKRDLPYILILDNCYYRKPVGGVQSLGITILDKFRDTGSEVARIGGREPAILLYAAKPGHYVKMELKHPSRIYNVGPLARRLLLLLKDVSESKKDLLVGDFLKQMNDPAFDPESVPGDHKAWIMNAQSAVLIPAGERVKPTESTR